MTEQSETLPVMKDGENKNKRINLMSIIDSLQPSTQENLTHDGDLPSCSSTSNTTTSQNINDKDFSCKMETDLGEDSIPANSFTNNAPSPEKDQERDVLGNILKLLTDATAGSFDNLGPNLNIEDESLLEMQQPHVSGIQQLLNCIANGTAQVKSILKNDVNLIYECKRCRGMFRALPNLIRHKKDYCKNTGIMSAFLNREINSTTDEDIGFQTVLNTLHPADPLTQNHQPFINAFSEAPPIQNHAMFSGNSAFIAPLPAPNDAPVHNAASRFIISNDSSLPITYRKPVDDDDNVDTVTSVSNKKRHLCPVCRKELSDRKSVRRHLVQIHGMGVIDSSNRSTGKRAPGPRPGSAIMQKPTVKKILKRVYEHSGNLEEISVETLDVGHGRNIYVLPEDYAISSSECPVCSRTLCRRTNVRRHLLEAHQFIIKGERKYHQLKEISGNILPGSPSLRNLRNVGLISESLKTPEKITSTNDKPVESNAKEFAPIREEEIKTTSQEEVKKKPGSSINKNLIMTDTSIKKHDSEVILPQVDTDSPSVSNKVKSLSQNHDANPLPVENAPSEPGNDSTGMVDVVLNMSVYKCCECSKSFTRRRTFKNHMFSFHKCSKNKFEEMYGNSDGTPTNEDSSKELKRNIKDEMFSNDDEPPKKILKSDVDSTIIKITPKVGALPRTTIVNAENISASKCVTLTPVTSATVIKHQKIIVASSNVTKVFQNGSSSKAKPIVLKSLPTSTSITPSNIRPLIQVKLHRSIVAKKSNPNSTTGPTKQISILPPKSPPTAQQTKTRRSFDLGKKVCYSCDKSFESSQEVKSHLMQVHAFSNEDALTFSTECSNVSPEDQKSGVDNGFDITLAKCLICSKLYFSRENLAKHMLKCHHVMPEKLKGLVPPDSISKTGIRQDVTQSPLVKTKPMSPGSPQKSKNTKKISTVASQKASQSSSIISPTSKVRSTVTLNGNCYAVSEESVIRALDIFPKESINPHALRCVKCKHKYKKAWDLKVHLLRHVGLGLYACGHCPKPTTHMKTVRSVDVMKHLQVKHKLRVTAKNRTFHTDQCRIDNKALWDAYKLPHGKR